MNNRNFSSQRIRRSRHAFTLIEVLVALGILAILLVIIVLPLRLGFDSFNKGNAQNLTQSAVQATLTDMGNDIRDAVYVFPNARVAGITNKPPYTNDVANSEYDAQLPYYISKDTTKTGEPTGVVCSNVKNWVNPARLDMIKVRRDNKGNVLTPLAPSYNIVTYYPRRQELTKPYDPVNNPIVMYRAEYPAFGISINNGTPQRLRVAPNGAFNAELDARRINFDSTVTATECGSTNAAITARSSQWLAHNYFGETDLLPLTKPIATTDFNISEAEAASYSQTLATPRGLALEATNAYRSVLGPIADAQGSLVPDTSFTTTDTNNDGKIDRVTISMGLASFSAAGEGDFDTTTNQPKGTVLRGTRTIDLPNIIK